MAKYKISFLILQFGNMLLYGRGCYENFVKEAPYKNFKTRTASEQCGSLLHSTCCQHLKKMT